MKRRFRLTRSQDFMRVRRSGLSFAHPLVVLVYKPNQTNEVHIGVTASRSVGNAVQRNRAKRRLRACCQKYLTVIKPGWDIIWAARRQINEASFQELCDGMRNLLHKAALIDSVPEG